MFVDTAKVRGQSGRGGDGCLSFRREKFVPRGGPDGGDGGRGGHIIFRATSSLTTLLPFRYQPLLRAKAGRAGMGSRKHGADGDDLVVDVPVGTIVRDADTGELIADMAVEAQETIVARGGRGGVGNERFKSSVNRAPRRTIPGGLGEEISLDLELKLLAEVGLLGMPNAGKSTLISRISASRPKIAEYPFTTLVPNLGVVDLGDYRSCVVADVPGLIPGAHEGKGLGDRFLRHLDRCSLLLHLLDASAPPEEALSNFDAIEAELSLASPSLAAKPRAAVPTKLDVTEARDHLPAILEGLAARGVEAAPISAVSGEGLKEALSLIARRLEEVRGQNAPRPEDSLLLGGAHRPEEIAAPKGDDS